VLVRGAGHNLSKAPALAALTERNGGRLDQGRLGYPPAAGAVGSLLAGRNTITLSMVRVLLPDQCAVSLDLMAAMMLIIGNERRPELAPGRLIQTQRWGASTPVEGVGVPGLISISPMSA